MSGTNPDQQPPRPPMPPPPSGFPPAAPPPAGSPPPAVPSPAPFAAQPPSARRSRGSWRVWATVGVLLVLVVGGCGTVAVLGGMRAFDALTAPMDVANDYLDAARSGGPLAPHACRPDDPARPEVVASRSQRLTSVEIDGGAIAEVRGSLVLSDDVPVPVLVTLGRRDGSWCVTGVVLRGG